MRVTRVVGKLDRVYEVYFESKDLCAKHTGIEKTIVVSLENTNTNNQLGNQFKI